MNILIVEPHFSGIGIKMLIESIAERFDINTSIEVVPSIEDALERSKSRKIDFCYINADNTILMPFLNNIREMKQTLPYLKILTVSRYLHRPHFQGLLEYVGVEYLFCPYIDQDKIMSTIEHQLKTFGQPFFRHGRSLVCNFDREVYEYLLSMDETMLSVSHHLCLGLSINRVAECHEKRRQYVANISADLTTYLGIGRLSNDMLHLFNIMDNACCTDHLPSKSA